MSSLILLLRQVRYTNMAFWRNPASAFFTFVFPLLFLVVFTSLLGGGTVMQNGVPFNQSTYYVAAMAAFSVIAACYTNIAISTSFQRDKGVLKRIRGTPLPGGSYLGARVAHAMLIAVVLVVLCAAFGRAFYEADVPSGMALGRTILTVLVGGASFAALGLAVTAIIPNAEASPAVVNASILPLLFISGIFIPIGDDTPAWISTVAAIFPVKHFADAFTGAYYGPPAFTFRLLDVGIVALWGLAGIALAVRFFTWEPRR